MRAFAEAWPDVEFVQQAAAQLPWFHFAPCLTSSRPAKNGNGICPKRCSTTGRAIHFRRAYLAPAMALGLVEMTLPESPRSTKQRYRLTAKGQQCLRDQGDGVQS